MKDYIVSVDLGQSQDYSALSVLRRRWWRAGQKPDLQTAKLWPEIPQLLRWPLGTPYPVIAQGIIETVRFVESVAQFGVSLVVDQGGPGRPVIDFLRKAKVRPIGVSITSGDSISVRPDESMTCPKKDICSSLVLAAQTGDLKVARNLTLASEFETEIKSFGYTVNRKTAKMTYESIVAQVHDDLVIAVALGLWYSTSVLSTAFMTGTRADKDYYAEYSPLS